MNAEGWLLGLWWIETRDKAFLLVFWGVVVSAFGVWCLSQPSSCRIRPPCLIGEALADKYVPPAKYALSVYVFLGCTPLECAPLATYGCVLRWYVFPSLRLCAGCCERALWEGGRAA